MPANIAVAERLKSPARTHWRGAWTRLAVCFVAMAAATIFVGLDVHTNLIWVANGFLLAYLLLAPRWRWPGYFVAGFAAQLLGIHIISHEGWKSDLILTVLNVLEAAIGAFLLRKRSLELPRFTDLRYLWRFLGFAVLAAPAIVGVLFTLFGHGWLHDGTWKPFRNWVLTDALGMAVATPAFVAVLRMRLRDAPKLKRECGFLLVLAPVTIFCFQQVQIPQTALIFPFLLLILLRLGLGWAALGTLFVAAAGSWFSGHGKAPLETQFGPLGAALRLQFMVGSAMFMLYSVSVVLETLRSTERKLQETVARHELVLANCRDIVLLVDGDGVPRYVSTAVAAITGWGPEETMERGLAGLVQPEDLPKIEAMVRTLKDGAESGMLEFRVRHRQGDIVWVEANLHAIRAPRSNIFTGIVMMVRDIGKRKAAQLARDFHQSLLGAIHEVSLDGVLVVDERGKAVSYNKRFSEIWKIETPDVPISLLKPARDVADEQLLSQVLDKVQDQDAFLKRVQELYDDRGANDQCQLELKDGRTLERYTTALHSEDGQYLGRVWFFRDISERKCAEEQLQAACHTLEVLAIRDALTGLANRRRFDECLATEWRRAGRDGSALSLVLIDVDLFKLYNDTYGHLQGDSCLRMIADSASSVISRPGDLVARFGGEEFAIILPATDSNGAVAVGTQVSRAVQSRGISHSGSPFGAVTISAGCATLIPGTGQSSSELIEMADQALYRAKRSGRNLVCKAGEQRAGAPASPCFDPFQLG